MARRRVHSAIQYDALGRLGQATLANGITAVYTWDAASQLTGITYKRADGSVLGDLTYGYDLAGVAPKRAAVSRR